MRVEPQQLKSFILDAGLITEEKIDKALRESRRTKQRIEDVLVNENLISQEDLIRLEAYILGIPFVNLEKEIIAPEILKIIPEPIARSHNIIAFRKKGKNLEVAMLDPEDLKMIEFIKKKSDLKILPRLTSVKSMKYVLSQYQESLQSEFGQIISRNARHIEQGPLKHVSER